MKQSIHFIATETTYGSIGAEGERRGREDRGREFQNCDEHASRFARWRVVIPRSFFHRNFPGCVPSLVADWS